MKLEQHSHFACKCEYCASYVYYFGDKISTTINIRIQANYQKNYRNLKTVDL